MRFRQRILGALAEAAVRRSNVVLAATGLVVAAAVAVLLLVGLGVQTSRVDLWPKEHELQKRFQAYQDLFGSPLQLIVVVSGPDARTNKAAAERVARAIRTQVKEIKQVFYKIDMRGLTTHALFYMPVDRLQTLARWLKEFSGSLSSEGNAFVIGGLVGLLERVNAGLAKIEDGDTTALGPLRSHARDIVKAGDGIFEEFGHWLSEPARRDFAVVGEVAGGAGAGDEGLDPDGYLVADGGRMVLLMCQPRQADDNVAYQKPLVEAVQQVLRAEAEHTPGIELGLTGMPAFAVDELTVATHDLNVVTLIAAIGVLLLFLVGYGSLRNTVFVALTLGCGILVDLAVVALVIGHVNLISSLFVAVLLGLGIDYGIQLINRFQEELAAGRPRQEALRAAVVNTGASVLTGGATTAMAFFCMAFGDFAPLRELGLIAGAGVLLILAASFVLLPTLLFKLSKPPSSARPGSLKAAVRGEWHLPVAPLRGRRAALGVLGVGVAITVALALPIRPITFSNDLISMLPQNVPSVRLLKRLEATGMFTTAFNASIVDSLAEARARSAKFAALSTVSRVQSVDLFLPKDQAQKQPFVDEVRTQWKGLPPLRFESPAIDVAALRRQLTTLAGYLQVDLPLTLRTNGLEELAPGVEALAKRVAAFEAQVAALPPAQVGERLGRLQARAAELLSDFQNAARATGGPVTPADLPEEVAGLLYKATPQGDRFLIRVYPKGDINDDSFMPRFLAETRSVDPHITGYPVPLYEFALVMQRSFYQAFLYAAVAIVLLLLLDLRRLRDTLLALIPLAMGSVWMVGTMNLAGIDYNLATIMAIPLMIGIGVAYGVYIIHRCREASPPRPRQVVRTTGKAVLFSALTTMMSFGAMVTASHRGAAGLGLTLLIGTTYCLLASVVILPALVRVLPPARPKK